MSTSSNTIVSRLRDTNSVAKAKESINYQPRLINDEVLRNILLSKQFTCIGLNNASDFD